MKKVQLLIVACAFAAVSATYKSKTYTPEKEYIISETIEPPTKQSRRISKVSIDGDMLEPDLGDGSMTPETGMDMKPIEPKKKMPTSKAVRISGGDMPGGSDMKPIEAKKKMPTSRAVRISDGSNGGEKPIEAKKKMPASKAVRISDGSNGGEKPIEAMKYMPKSSAELVGYGDMETADGEPKSQKPVAGLEIRPPSEATPIGPPDRYDWEE